MTASAATMVALGMAPELAKNVGDTISTAIAGIGTAQSGAALLTGTVNTLTTAGGATAFITPSHNAGRSIEVFNTSATSALVFCPVGATMNGSANGSVTVAQNKGALIRFITPTQLVTVTGA